MHVKRIDILQCQKNLALTLILFSIATGIAKPQVSQQGAPEARIERVLSGLRPPVAIKGQPPEKWTLAYNEYQAQEEVTLRRILSHSSGLTVGGFAGYRVGEPLPSLLQILNGERPGNNPPIRVDFVPGSKFRYSGGGAEVMQQLLLDVTGQPFPELMNRLVLTPE